MWCTASTYRCCTNMYIGETGRRVRERFSEHLRSIRNRSPGLLVAEHFNSANHTIDDISVCGVKQCRGSNTSRKRREMQLIFELGTLKPGSILISVLFEYFHFTSTLFGCSFLVRAFYVRIFQLGFCMTQRAYCCTLKKGYAQNVCALTNYDTLTCLTRVLTFPYYHWRHASTEPCPFFSYDSSNVAFW